MEKGNGAQRSGREEDMSDAFKDFAATPTLTLEPDLGETSAAPAPVEKTEVQELNDSILSDEERRMVDEFSGQIDLRNSNMILQYGAGAQKKMADFSEKALENVQTQDLGEVGELLGSVVTELKSFDAEEERGILGFFKRGANKITAMKAKYAKAEANVNRICQVLEGHQVQLMKDSAMLDKMYELNRTYFKELSMYILAGKKKLQEVREGELKRISQKAQVSGLPEDAQEARDLDAMCNRFEKKLHDLELTRMISIQTAPQIRLVQNNDTMMVEKIQSTIVNTIPLWKSQIVIALGLHRQESVLKMQRSVSDATNTLLTKNAELLRQNSTEVARESERGIVDLQTLKKVNADLISTIEETIKIQQEGRAARQNAETELLSIEQKLKEALLTAIQ